MGYSPGNYSSPVPGYGTSLVDRMNLYVRIRRYFKFLAERWLLLIIFTAVGLGIGVWVAISKPDVYRAQSTLAYAPRLQLGRSDASIDDGSSAEAVVSLMRSPAVLVRVEAKLKEGKDNQYKLSVPEIGVYVGRGNTFLLNVTSTNFAYAKDFSETWAQEFVDFHKQQRKNLLGTTEAQLASQISTYETKLEKAQLELDDFQRKNSIASAQDAGLSALTQLEKKKQEYEQISLQLKMFETTDAEALASGAVNGTSLLSGPALNSGASKSAADPGKPLDGDSNPDNIANRMAAGSGYAELRKSIHGLELELQDKSRTLKPKHPYVIELNRMLAVRKDQLKLELQLVDEMRKARVQVLRNSLPGYVKIIDELQTVVFESTELKTQLTKLEDTRKDIKENLDLLNKQLQSMGRVSADEDRFAVVSAGVGDTRPVGPDRPKLVLGGAGGGFLLAVALMFLLHRLDDRLESPEDIEAKLEEPVLGQLPEVDKKHNTEGYLLLTRMKAHTMFAESLRGVRSALLLSAEGGSKRMLAVTSAVPGDGKTTFTTNFSVTIAAAGNRTLLIDADLRRGNIHGYFEQPLEGGLAEVLEGRLAWKDAVHETGIKHLYFMRAGERPNNPSELLIGPKTRELIEALRTEFDYVIFDCPPLTAIDDTFSIAAYLDGLFFVVRAGRTSMRFAKIGINTIHQRGAPLLGLVINGVPIDNPYYYYTSYYYSSYYHRPLTPDENVYQDSPARRGKRLDGAPIEAAAAVAVQAKNGGQ